MTPALGAARIGPGHHRALVVDDEPLIRSVVRRWFERQGWRVDEADDGSSALALLQQPPGGAEYAYDIILADLRMRELSGADLHQWLVHHRPELLSHFVIATGDVHQAEAAEFLSRTGCRVLQKPFELDALAELVSSSLPS